MDKNYYDICIKYIPQDIPSLKKLVSLMKYFGYKGVGIPKIILEQNDLPSFPIDIIFTNELKNTNSSKLYSQINNSSKKSECTIVVGDNEKNSRSIVETSGVDILSLPLDNKACSLDYVVAKFAADRGIALEFDLGAIIRYRGGKRVLAMIELKHRLMLARKFNLNLVLTTGAQSIYDIRSPHDLISLSYLVGMTKEEAINGMTKFPNDILYKKRNPNYIMDDIEIANRITEEIL